ncbi:flagellar basal-body rod modification protein FlgD [Tardiphaga sp. OK246]|jgi:flagellar basal-body rod modification protein FlgD|uniref:flagellar hook assembly protein FlgD n=1 Tax=unclassified Tardiphaga TaxID=2631404 RepID=UPI000B683A12|nr:flagellar hook capping FlgD N-terminal domain-containing protein [Tardiphaga sp. OK246]SNT56617.1 flagellar basal-body rod modification protein FlgD [Tardiphaga sp. OK246]
MTVAATTSTTTTTASTASSSSVTSAITSQQFLNLLVTELQNQNPLDPTNSTDFINQLTSYANFDQQQTLNSNMGTLVSSLNSLLTLNSSNYIGQTVTAKTDTGTLKDGQISFGYSLESAASDVTLSVKDSSGNTVWTGSGTTASGTNSFTWDGTTTDGTQLTDGGQYTLNVSATDSTGQSVYGYTTVTGKVTSIDNSSGTPMLNIGSTSVSTSNVIGVTS